MNKMRIVPALLGANPLQLAGALEDLNRSSADGLHVDVIDGNFAPGLSFGMKTVAGIMKFTQLDVEVHLQVLNPYSYLEELVALGVGRIIIHVEGGTDPFRLVRTFRARGLITDVAINPATPVSYIEEMLPAVDGVVVMTSSPGTSDFVDWAAHKVRNIRKSLDRLGRQDTRIAVDGGVTIARVRRLAEHGADTFIAASAIFSHPEGITEACLQMRAETS